MFYIVGLIAGVVSFATGCLWYTALFGRIWRKGMGFSDERVKLALAPRRVLVAMAGELVAAVGTTAVLLALPFSLVASAGLMAAIVISHGVKLAIFDGKSPSVILINEGYKLATVLITTIGVFVFGGQMAG